MHITKSILGVFTATALLSGTALLGQGYPQQGYNQGPPPPGYYQGGPPQPWEQAPREFQEVERRGFHDGIEGARKDFGNHRPPSVENRDEFRHPPVGRADRRAYREAFRRGYQAGVEHIYQGR